ncbi:MAG: AMP-binding protein [Bacteroidota bacterium]
MLIKIVDSLQQHATKLAFCIHNREYTYGDLATCVSGIRGLLRKERPTGHFIGLLAYDAIETYAAIIAIWLEGRAFVPLSPKSPEDRHRNILAQVDSHCIMSVEPVKGFSSGEKPIRVLATKGLRSEELLLDIPPLAEDQIVSMLFTSGSTGLPKGVPYTLKNINSTLDAFFALDYHLTPKDRFLQMFELTFDMSMLSYLPPLCIGASVFTLGQSGMKYLQVYQLLQEQQLTFAAMVPSTLNLLRPYFSQIHLPHLRLVLLGGEPFYLDLAMEWFDCIPNARLINISGPCETTMACVGYEVKRERSENKALHQILAFGRPWKNTAVLIVDEQLQPVGLEATGELCFAGDHVMQGYWQMSERNQQIFFEREVDGQMLRFYRSGDMAYLDDEGDLYSCGRKDHQYKIQGYKVELGEIEQVAMQWTKGIPVAVVVKRLNNGLLEIHLLVEQQGVEEAELKAYLQGKLPPYMIPKSIRGLAVFPRTLSGKIDRWAISKTQ